MSNKCLQIFFIHSEIESCEQDNEGLDDHSYDLNYCNIQDLLVSVHESMRMSVFIVSGISLCVCVSVCMSVCICRKKSGWHGGQGRMCVFEVIVVSGISFLSLYA